MDIIQIQTGLIPQNIIGKGAFGTVYRVIQPQTNKIYALKVINKLKMPSIKRKNVEKQTQMLLSFQHPNIIKYHSCKQTQQWVYLKMDYIQNGTLKTFIKNKFQNNQSFSNQEIAIIMKALLSGLSQIHKSNIIHRDIKPQNILLSDPTNLSSLKIADFGLSAQLDITYPKNVKAQCGTLLFMAPEMLFDPSYTKAIDIWSSSIIIHPLYETNMKLDQYKQKLKKSSFPPLKDSLAQNFIEKISKRQYNQRYSANEALKHPWITRDFQDEIPLSVYQSYNSFSTTHYINQLFKLALTLQNQKSREIKKQSYFINQQYKLKLKLFSQNIEKKRVSSPSRKRKGQKNQQLFKKMKLILNQTETLFKTQSVSPSKTDDEPASPVLRQHDKFFTNLFQKQRLKKKNSQTITLIMMQTQQPQQKLKKTVSCNEDRVQIFQQKNKSKQINCKDQKKLNKIELWAQKIEIDSKVQSNQTVKQTINNILLNKRPNTGDNCLKNNILYSRSNKQPINLLSLRQRDNKSQRDVFLNKRNDLVYLQIEKSRPTSYRNPHLGMDYGSMTVSNGNRIKRMNSISKNDGTKPMFFGKGKRGNNLK